MKLIGATTSPYVRKVRIVMAEKKLDYQFVQENVWADDTHIATSNPLGKVPCLVMEGGEAVFDSRVIVEYLDTLSPVGKLIPSQGRERAEVKTWEALADGVMDAGILARLEATWVHRKDSERSQAWIDRQLLKVNDGLKSMSQGLGDKPYCSGIHLSLSDIAVGPGGFQAGQDGGIHHTVGQCLPGLDLCAFAALRRDQLAHGREGVEVFHDDARIKDGLAAFHHQAGHFAHGVGCGDVGVVCPDVFLHELVVELFLSHHDTYLAHVGAGGGSDQFHGVSSSARGC